MLLNTLLALPLWHCGCCAEPEQDGCVLVVQVAVHTEESLHEASGFTDWPSGESCGWSLAIALL